MNQKITSILIVCAMLLMGITVNIENNAQGAFVDQVSVPWDSSFTPSDSAWDSSGEHCIVIGEDTSGIRSSAWHYNESSGWSQISESGGVMMNPGNYAKNLNSGLTYPTIQGAIDSANAGDTINVWAGSYTENIAVGIPINLIGNGSFNTVIDGGASGTVITITVDYVNVSGLQVASSGAGNAGIFLNNADNCRIDNITAIGNGDGIRLEGSSNNVIIDNDIEDNDVGLNATSIPEIDMLVGTTTYGGYTASGTMFEMDPSGSDYNMMHQFELEYDEGRYTVYGTLAEDIFDLYTLYGVTRDGGLYDKGTIYRTDKDGTFYETLHHFEGIKVGDNPATGGDNPTGTLLQIGNTLYGVTTYGGVYDLGLIYKINTDGSDFTILHDFGSGASDGSTPYYGLIYDGISLYGTTYFGGTSGIGAIYKMSPDGSGFTVLHSFTNGATGYYPRCELLLDGTTLYGTSYYGGSGLDGTIYSIETDGSAITVIHDFIGGVGDGENPYDGVVTDGVNLYGMTLDGGTSNLGVVYSINKGGGGTTLLHSFRGSALNDGSDPNGKLVLSGGILYGMTRVGDGIVESLSRGIIFSVDVGGGAYNILHEFVYADGYNPYGSLIFDGSDLFGTTYYGGMGSGTVFKFNKGSGILTVLHSFYAVVTSDGYNPYGDLIQDGTSLYGTTYLGGAFNSGTIYRTDLDGSGHTILHHFNGVDNSNGDNPYSGLTQVGTTLYGTTYDGGSSSVYGSIYKINTDGTDFTIIHNFTSGVDGAYPRGALTWDGSFLYGMTYGGGTSGVGTIYRIDHLNGASYTTMHTFTGLVGLDGDNPYGSLMDDGTVLYGMARDGGSADLGVIFKVDKTVPYTVTILHNFTGGVSDGQDPYGGLASDGTYLYGMTYYGGVSGHGTIFRMKKDSSGFGIMHSFDYNTDMGYPDGSLLLDGSSLYGMVRYGGPGILLDGGVFKISTASEFTALHYFEDYPYDGADPYYSGVTMVTHPAIESNGNLIYHNNFIDNTMQAWDDTSIMPGNSWSNGLPDGGNHWSDYAGVDIFPAPNGIGDSSYSILGAGAAKDSYPWMREDGWRLPYSKFISVAWDEFNGQFWLTCEDSADATSTIYYVQSGTPTTMIPIPAPAITFTAIAADNLGNVLIGGNDLDAMYYYDGVDGHEVTEIGTGKMWGWNITSISFNPNDDRFYIVGNIMNQDKGVAFFTDEVPLNSGSAKCYKDSSSFMNSPGPAGLKAIAWNPTMDYGLAVGDGVYRLDPYDGNPGYELYWTEIGAPTAGTQYSDVSWDTDGWNEAGICGDDNTNGAYWRYYHSNPQLQNGYTNGIGGTEYTTCAMKPPSSPKWLLVVGPSGGLQVNIEELDQSTDLSASYSLVDPNIYWVGFNDTGMASLNNQMANPDSWFNIAFEYNYSGGWDQVRADITFWYDDGWTGTNSLYPAENEVNRNKAFNLTYEPLAAQQYKINYPIAPELETTIGVVSDTVILVHPTDIAQSVHRVVLQVRLGAQSHAADGNGFAPAGPDSHSDPNIAFDNPNSWDFNVTLVDVGDDTKTNSTYGEFGIKQAVSISISGNPSGEAAPGAFGIYLGASTIEYSTNTQYWVNVSIPHLYLDGDVGNPAYIPADNMRLYNANNLASLPWASDIAGATYLAADVPVCVWGHSTMGTLSPPSNGTTAHGPWGSNYNNYENPGGTTSVNWYVDMPAAVLAGTYQATISYSIETSG